MPFPFLFMKIFRHCLGVKHHSFLNFNLIHFIRINKRTYWTI